MYDLDLLSKARVPIDDLIDRARPRGVRSLFENTLYPGFRDVEFKLVDDYEKLGKQHIEDVQKDKSLYGYLYFLSENNKFWFNKVNFDYANFPLIRGRECILSKIRIMAEKFHQRHTNNFDATCLYLLYFYALLVNPKRNWITMDYLANGNKYHQLGTRLTGVMTRGYAVLDEHSYVK